MNAASYFLQVVRTSMPKIRFVTRLHNSDIIGIEQEYILKPARGRQNKGAVVEYESISEQDEKLGYISISHALEKYNAYDLSRNKLYAMCVSGELEAFQEKTGKRVWWISEDSLLNYLRSS